MTNTIIGPIMAVLFSASVLVMGVDKMQQFLEIPINIKRGIPFAVAGILSMMPATSTSISMEGKEWWIIKSIPIKTKAVLDGKILLNLSLILPFFVVSEVLLTIALKPDFMELVWMIVIPVVLTLFGLVFGITVNLKMPVFNWENEVTVVKQSASSMLGGLGGIVMALVCVVPVLLIPSEYTSLLEAIVCVVVVCLTAFLYKKNSAVNLQEL